MSTPQPRKAVPRAMVRIDDDLHETLRHQAFYQKSTVTRLVNDLIRFGIPLAEAGIFNHPINDIVAALDTITKQKGEPA